MPTNAAYLRSMGLIFQRCRGQQPIDAIACECGLAPTTITNLEHGATDVTSRSQAMLAKHYGFSLADLHRRALELARSARH